VLSVEVSEVLEVLEVLEVSEVSEARRLPSSDQGQGRMADAPPIHGSSLPTSALPNVVVAVTFDPFGLCEPLQIWLRQLTGLSAAVLWTPYGSVLESLRTPGSAWNENGQRGINVLIARACDLTRETTSPEPAAVLVDAVRQSSALRRGGVTIAIIPPDGTAAAVAPAAVMAADTTVGDDPAMAVPSIGGEDLASMLSGCPGVVVVDEAAVGAAFSCLGGRKNVSLMWSKPIPSLHPSPSPSPNTNLNPGPNPNPAP
jgi:hypothetical protein